MKLKNQKVLGAAILGFIAPLTVALASGVHAGEEAAGWFMAASWACAFFFVALAKLVESIGGSIE